MTIHSDADALHMEQIDMLHSVLDPLKDCGVLSDGAHEKINDHVNELLTTIGKMNGIRNEEEYWQAFQKLFGFAHESKKIVPMNAANLCPEPTLLLEAANLLRLEYNKNVAQQVRMGAGERVKQLEKAREALAKSLNVEQSSLAILRNASEGNNAINCGYRKWQPNDEVVLWTQNHPTNLGAWAMRGGRKDGQGKFRIVTVDFLRDATPAEVAEIVTDKMNKNTRFVSLSETANSTGFRIPKCAFEEIWEKAKEIDNCHVHIDGTMAWGASDLKDLPLEYCHSFVSSAHKWFLGPKETGILYMNPEKAANFMPSIFAYNYKIEIGDPLDLPENASRFELIGQRDDVNIITLLWTQMMWNRLAGNDFNPYTRVQALSKYLKDMLQESGWTKDFITPLDPLTSRGVVRVKALKERRVDTLYDYLYNNKNFNFNIAGSGDDKTFRLCPHIYNTKNDIGVAVRNMNEWKKST